MIEILICDDDKYFCGSLEKDILDWASKTQYSVNIEQCYSGKSLRQSMKEVRPYLLFLDIELGDDTGIQIGKYVRDYLKDENLQIVFVTSHTQYALQLFQIRPFDFLTKPINTAYLNQMLSKFCEIKLCEEKKYFVYQQKHNAHRIDLDDIMYFQSDRKKIRIYTESLLLSVRACILLYFIYFIINSFVYYQYGDREITLISNYICLYIIVFLVYDE